MWVDQKDLKLYITGADMPRIHAAARLVGDLISKAPVNVNSAGVEDEVSVIMRVRVDVFESTLLFTCSSFHVVVPTSL